MIARPVRRASVDRRLRRAAAAACGGEGGNLQRGAPTRRRVSRAAAATTSAPAGELPPRAACTRSRAVSCACPSGAQAGRTPLLLVVIPGGDGDARRPPRRRRRRGRTARASRSSTRPRAGSGFWQLNEQFGTSDVTDVTGLIQRQVATGCFDPNRISITGVSNGAGFTARMGCELPTDVRRRRARSRRGYKRARPVPGDRARVVPRHPRDRRHGRPDQRQEARPQGQRRRATRRRGPRRDGCAATPRTTTPRRARDPRRPTRGCDGGTRVERVRADRDRPRLAADQH